MWIGKISPLVPLTGKTFSDTKPSGHAARMAGYSEVSNYSVSDRSVDEERNKTELSGNPLNSR